MNLPSNEYLHMPYNDLLDLISAYQIINGFNEESNEDNFIPDYD